MKPFSKSEEKVVRGKMERNEILQKVAPCSLMYYTYSAYNKGIICEVSNTLLKYLDGIKEFYEKHIPNAVEDYKKFEEVLNGHCAASCFGCRSTEHNGCSIKECFLLECMKKHGIDFCGACKEFPCEKIDGLFEEEIHRQWLHGNQ